MLKKIYNFLNSKKELFLIITMLTISGIAHGYNMFNFPYFENDEGTYMSQAWSLLYQGELSPYTYWYDHAPLGWVFTSLWLLITGGPYTFGYSLNSGRVFMLVIHILSTFFVIKIGKKLSNNIWVGILAASIFSLSPLGLYFQRRLLLDNIMIFWILLAYYLIIAKSKNLSTYILSAIFFAIAVLTKENAVFFIPGFLISIYQFGHKHNQKFVIIKWVFLVGLIVSMYFLFAFIKGELFPTGTFLGGSDAHVSLLETLKYQSSRDGGSVLQPDTSSFWISFKLWLQQDTVIILGGLIATIATLVISIKKSARNYLGITALSIFFWLFLIRGGLVIEFYIVPLLPILALLMSISVIEIVRLFSKNSKTHTIMLLLVCSATYFFYSNTNQVSRAFGVNSGGYYFYSSNQTYVQKAALQWIRSNLSTDTVIAFDDHSHLELTDPDNPSGVFYPKAAWYWKLNLDPAIREKLIPNGPEDIDYFAKTPQMEYDISLGGLPILHEALENSNYVTSFHNDGWNVEIWATRYPSKILPRAWEYYKQRFIVDKQYTVDPANGLTTSEGQSYTMLRAVWSNDKAIFDSVWEWTKQNMQKSDGTISWRYQEGEITDDSSATDGDVDIALALVFASKQWNDEQYLADAQEVLNGIWETEVKKFDGKYYILPGNWAKNKNTLITNPSYLSPYAYKIFADVDKSHNWHELVYTSYEVLENCMLAEFGSKSSVGLPPNWCAYDANGNPVVPEEEGLKSTDYSYDAIRTMWRLALDYKWYGDPRALKLLRLSGEFLEEKWTDEGKILVGYTHDGADWEKYESVLGYATNIANFAVTSPEIADTIYDEKIAPKFYEDFDTGKHYWEDPDNYYTQNWAWFGTALYSDNLPNLWEE